MQNSGNVSKPTQAQIEAEYIDLGKRLAEERVTNNGRQYVPVISRAELYLKALEIGGSEEQTSDEEPQYSQRYINELKDITEGLIEAKKLDAANIPPEKRQEYEDAVNKIIAELQKVSDQK